jgi:DNA-binding NtrC family response regulator
VIISSGYVTEQLRSDAVRAGVRDVLQKEYTLEQLGDLVHRALGNAGKAG